MARRNRNHNFTRGARVKVIDKDYRDFGRIGIVEFVHEVCYDYHKNHYGYEAVVKFPDGKEGEFPVEAVEEVNVIDMLGQIGESA